MERSLFISCALGLPAVEQGGHMGATDFRLRKKIFSTLTTDDVAGFRLSPEVQVFLMEKDACFFKANGAWGDRGWTKAPLADLSQADAEFALRNAWRGCASKRQLAAFET